MFANFKPGDTAVAGNAQGLETSKVFSAWHDPVARILNVDLLTVLIVILLPWSTTGVVIVAVLWIVALIPTAELRALLRSLSRPVSALPIAFFALALVGTLWSDASWSERLYAVGPTAKLLMLPLLLYHFERSPRGMWVFIAFLASCTLLMAVSWIVAFDPDLSLKPQFAIGPYAPNKGIFVKNYIDQSQEFALCAVALAYPITILLRAGRGLLALLLSAIALSFVVNMMFVAISRTALVTMPIMLAVFALLHLKKFEPPLPPSVALIARGLGWNDCSICGRRYDVLTDYETTPQIKETRRHQSRLLFWRKSLRIFCRGSDHRTRYGLNARPV